jgi:hypothetical protein
MQYEKSVVTMFDVRRDDDPSSVRFGGTVGNEAPAAPRKSWGRRLVSFSWRALVALVVIYAVARAGWKFSGSNEWELWRDRKGVQIYTLKQPGADLERVRGVVTVKSSMSGMVKWLLDDDTCKDIGCTNAKTWGVVDERIRYSTFRYDLPKPFKPREFVVREHVHQIPSTKEVWLEIGAVPEKLPPNDCCVRVTNMSNTWRLTPVGKGMIEVEYTLNMNEGGFVPDLILNKDRPRYIYSELRKLQKYLESPKYKNAKYDFIVEP